MNLPIIASKYPPKNRKAVWLQLDDNGGIKSIRKASNNGGFNTLTKTNGITYNEELNSIAIGEETVAIGKDQFVFGRKNVQDANKVEIVGNGNEFITIKTNTFNNSDDYIKPECSIVYVKQFVRRGNPSITYNVGRIVSVASNSYQLNTNTQLNNVSNMAVGYYAYIKVGTNEIIFSASDNGITSGSPVRYGTDLNLLNSFGNYKNIRTLDWQGNQWNAGDITCDDGNGNTISLRTLAQQIASLSAATTSNEPE